MNAKRFLLSMLLAIPLVAKPNIISEGWHTDKQPVDANSQEFLDVVNYLSAATGITPKLVAYPMGDFTSKLAPHVLEFACPNSAFIDAGGVRRAAKIVQVDAVLTYYYPDTSAVDIARDCNLHQLTGGRFVRRAPVVPVGKVAVKAPASYVGAQAVGCTYYALAGDPTKSGTVVAEARGKFTKHVTQTPFGPSPWYFLNGCK